MKDFVAEMKEETGRNEKWNDICALHQVRRAREVERRKKKCQVRERERESGRQEMIMMFGRVARGEMWLSHQNK